MAHGGARKGKWRGKLANAVGSQYPSHYLGTWFIQHYYRWWRTPRLPVVDWTDATTADLNGLVRFAERRNLVSARVPSHFNWPLLSYESQIIWHLRNYSHKHCNIGERFSGEFGPNKQRLTGQDDVKKRWYQTVSVTRICYRHSTVPFHTLQVQSVMLVTLGKGERQEFIDVKRIRVTSEALS